MSRHLRIMMVALGLAVGGLVWLFVYASFIDRAPPIVFLGSFGLDEKNQKVSTIKAGSVFYAHREFAQVRDMVGSVSFHIRSIDEPSRILLTSPTGLVEHFQVGHYIRDFPVTIPSNTPPGNYVYEVSIAYRTIWFARPIVVVLPPIYFKVVG